MSRKTMDEYPDIKNIWEPAEGMHPQNANTRIADLDKLTDSNPTDAYQKAWDKGHHLADATECFTDALWGVSEGKRDARK
jgi:hypothetical protein